MVFGEPVFNTEQRRAILQQYKDHIDELRKKKSLSSWDEVIKKDEQEEEQKEKKQTKKRRKNLSKTKKRRRKRRKRKTTKTTLLKLKKLLCNDWYIK